MQMMVVRHHHLLSFLRRNKETSKGAWKVKKIIIILSICLVITAIAIGCLKMTVDKEWKKGLYLFSTEIESVTSSDDLTIDFQVVAVGKKYKEILDGKDYKLSLYNSQGSFEGEYGAVYSMDASDYSQFLIRVILKDTADEKIEGILISSGNDILLDEKVNIDLKRKTDKVSGVKIDTATAITAPSGFENMYFIINESDEVVTFEGIRWDDLKSENTIITYVDEVEIGTEKIDMSKEKEYTEGKITIGPRKELVVLINYSDVEPIGKLTWGSPSFLINGIETAPEDLGILTLYELPTEHVVTLIKED